MCTTLKCHAESMTMHPYRDLNPVDTTGKRRKGRPLGSTKLAIAILKRQQKDQDMRERDERVGRGLRTSGAYQVPAINQGSNLPEQGPIEPFVGQKLDQASMSSWKGSSSLQLQHGAHLSTDASKEQIRRIDAVCKETEYESFRQRPSKKEKKEEKEEEKESLYALFLRTAPLLVCTDAILGRLVKAKLDQEKQGQGQEKKKKKTGAASSVASAEKGEKKAEETKIGQTREAEMGATYISISEQEGAIADKANKGNKADKASAVDASATEEPNSKRLRTGGSSSECPV